jgi:hypothetical protein
MIYAAENRRKLLMTHFISLEATASRPLLETPNLDLERLVRRLVAEDGFADSEAALRAIAVYERFFFLVMRRPECPLVPSILVDRVWQRHMLDTKAYTQDCLRWASQYVHRDEGAPHEAFERCVRLLGVSGEAEWDCPSLVHAHLESAARIGGNTTAETLHDADFSSLLARVRSSLEHKASVLPWIEEAQLLATVDPALAVEEYKRFLTLLIEETSVLTPCKLIDEFWHQHILDSRNYCLFCSQVAGKYLHHVPRYEKTHGFHEPGFQQTQVLYQKRFGAEPPPQLWAHRGESGGCSSEPAPLYTLDSATQMQAKITAGKVDKRHYDQVHPVLQRKGLPVSVWGDFLHRVDAVPQISWSEWVVSPAAVQTALILTIAGALASLFAFAYGGSFSTGIIILVGMITGFLMIGTIRKRDAKKVEQVLSDYAPMFARFGIGLEVLDNTATFLVRVSDHERTGQEPE